MLNAEGLLARLNAGGYSVRGKCLLYMFWQNHYLDEVFFHSQFELFSLSALSLKTGRLLLTLMDVSLAHGFAQWCEGLVGQGASSENMIMFWLGLFLVTRTFQADKSGDLDLAEVFKLEHFVSVVRREYVESYESGIPPSVTQTQLKKAISARGNSNNAAIQGRCVLFVWRANFLLCLTEIDLDAETFRALWNEYQTGGRIEYDEYVAVLAKLQVLKGQLISRIPAPDRAGPWVSSCGLIWEHLYIGF